MADNNRPDEPSRGGPEKPAGGNIGLILGGVLAMAAMMFILTGGQLGGVKEIKGDADLPPVASPAAPAKK